ncbi:MAG: Fructose-bisphosphate aldolase class II [Brockia lithotrophica]|uniref:Fructose-bisphosphate aldolase class II n=1 Tax=Brockia lithotrophica TaxID=933949 RepID=A0A2T5GAZ5_9BACL|nr:class II fructose-1,6-bisphosphate aldolase [Brockia lithotrophica]PTQ53355.1 MAG: Fructose-bisphosphate aldolase class II [Brockia lithotrophica]
MPLVSMTELMQRARKEKFAVGQFNLNNLEFAQAIVEAAEEERSPLIFGVSQGAIKYMGGWDLAVAIAKTLAERTFVPVVLHLDHGTSFEQCAQAIRAGFTSVMFDGSHLSLEENIRETKLVVRMARAVGVSVEGEVGAIGGTEDEITNEEELLARPEDGIRFYEETGVDALALSVGTAHGVYKGVPNIRHHIIQAVTEKIPVPVVLHGASGVPDDQIRRAIEVGVGKVNINTENMQAMTEAVRRVLAEQPDLYDPRKYLGPGREAIKAVVKAKMRLFGSSGRV